MENISNAIMMENTSNTSASACGELGMPRCSHVAVFIMAPLLIFANVFGTIGNAASLFFFGYDRKNYGSPPRIFIIAMTSVDLGTCSVVIPMVLYVLLSPLSATITLLTVFRFISTWSVYLTMFLIITNAYERFIAICRPHSFAISKQKYIFICLCQMILSLVLAMLSIFPISTGFISKSSYMYKIYAGPILYSLTSLIIIILYAMIWRELLISNKIIVSPVVEVKSHNTSINLISTSHSPSKVDNTFQMTPLTDREKPAAIATQGNVCCQTLCQSKAHENSDQGSLKGLEVNESSGPRQGENLMDMTNQKYTNMGHLNVKNLSGINAHCSGFLETFGGSAHKDLNIENKCYKDRMNTSFMTDASVATVLNKEQLQTGNTEDKKFQQQYQQQEQQTNDSQRELNISGENKSQFQNKMALPNKNQSIPQCKHCEKIPEQPVKKERHHQDSLQQPSIKTVPHTRRGKVQSRIDKRNRRMILVFFVVSIVFLLSWLPEWLLNFNYIGKEWRSLCFVNNVTNPIVYLMLNRRFRASVTSRLMCKK